MTVVNMRRRLDRLDGGAQRDRRDVAALTDHQLAERIVREVQQIAPGALDSATFLALSFEEQCMELEKLQAAGVIPSE